MPLDRLLASFRSLRTRLMLWNAGAVAVTGLLTLMALRAAVRYTLIDDLDHVLREDLKEIQLHFADNQSYDWQVVAGELNRKAEGHDFHRWFVQFYDAYRQPSWASINTPQLPPLTTEQTQQPAFTLYDYRLSYIALQPPIPEAAAVAVGCSQRYVARDMETIDRLAIGTGLLVLLLSPVVGHLLTSRT